MTKRILKYIFLCSILLVLQYSLIPLLSIYGIYPDLLLIVVILAVLRHGTIAAIILGFMVGMLQDAIFTNLYGVHALAKSIAAFTAGRFTKNKNSFNLQIVGMLAFMTVLVHNLLYDGIYYLHSGYDFIYLLIRIVIPNTIYTFIVLMVVYVIFPDSFEKKK